MSLFRRAQPRQAREFFGISGAADLIPGRGGGARRAGSVTVTDDTALRHSAVWACLRLRADLISTFPCDVFRDFEDLAIAMPKPPILVNPGGVRWDLIDWMWASQHDLDKTGNTIGLITERNGITSPLFPEGLPARIDMQAIGTCSVIERKGKGIKYRIDGKEYDPWQVWHEKQFPVNGLPVGLSPVMYAAWSVGEYLSLQQHGLDWFSNGGVPKARMRNVAKRLTSEEREQAKHWYRDTIQNGDLLVTGSDWEYDMVQAETVGMEWLEGRRFGLADVARFFGAPADLIEAAASAGGNITYANITQRNLQFLIHHLGPAVIRREKALSKLIPKPRYVKFNTDALLRMDPLSREKVIRSRVDSNRLTITEARELENLGPLTAAQKAEMAEMATTAPTKPAPADDGVDSPVPAG